MEEFIIYLIVLFIVLALFISYLLNIVRLIRAQEINGLTLARVVGIFVFPLGVILGFISNRKE